MAQAHSGPVYLAIRLQRFRLRRWTGESGFTDAAMAITGTRAGYKYERRTDLASLHVNCSHRRAHIPSISRSRFKFNKEE